MKKIYIIDNNLYAANELKYYLNLNRYEPTDIAIDNHIPEKILTDSIVFLELDFDMDLTYKRAIDFVNKRASDCSIVVMGTLLEKEAIEYFLEKGAVDFLIKPFKRRDINRVLKYILLDDG